MINLVIASLWTIFLALLQFPLEYFVALTVFVILDTATGAFRAKRLKDFNVKVALIGLAVKFGKYSAFIIMSIMLSNVFNVEGGIKILHEISHYIDDIVFASLLYLEARSIAHNTGNDNIFALIKKLATTKYKQLDDFKKVIAPDEEKKEDA